MRTHIETYRDSDLMTVDQVAEELGLSTRSIWRMISAGRIEARRIGLRAVRIRRADLAEFIDDAPVIGGGR